MAHPDARLNALGRVEGALGGWPGVFRYGRGRIVGFWGLAIRGMPHRLMTDAGAIYLRRGRRRPPG